MSDPIGAVDGASVTDEAKLFVKVRPHTETTPQRVSTKIRDSFESFGKKIQPAVSSIGKLAGRVKDAIVRNKRIVLIIAGVALAIFGIAEGAVPAAIIGGGLVGWNIAKLYLEKQLVNAFRR